MGAIADNTQRKWRPCLLESSERIWVIPNPVNGWDSQKTLCNSQPTRIDNCIDEWRLLVRVASENPYDFGIFCRTRHSPIHSPISCSLPSNGLGWDTSPISKSQHKQCEFSDLFTFVAYSTGASNFILTARQVHHLGAKLQNSWPDRILCIRPKANSSATDVPSQPLTYSIRSSRGSKAGRTKPRFLHRWPQRDWKKTQIQTNCGQAKSCEQMWMGVGVLHVFLSEFQNWKSSCSSILKLKPKRN